MWCESLLLFLAFLFTLSKFGVWCYVSVDSSITLKDFITKTKKLSNTWREFMRPWKSYATLFYIEEVKKEVMFYSSADWVDCMSLTLDEFDDIHIMTILQASGKVVLLFCSVCLNLYKFSEHFKTEHLVLFITLVVSKTRPVLENHNFLVFDLCFKTFNPNWVKNPIPSLFCNSWTICICRKIKFIIEIKCIMV